MKHWQTSGRSAWRRNRRNTRRCRFVRSRDTHMARHGVRVRQGECFPGCNLRYPGDPNGSAKEVINCHCYLQVGVLLPGETMDADGSIRKAENDDSQRIQAQNGLQSGAESNIIKTWEEMHAEREIIKDSELSNGIPWKGKPNSITDRTNDTGGVIQRRVCDENGVAKIDFDTTDHNRRDKHPTGAHKHIMNPTKKNPHGKPLPLTDEELEQNSDIIKEGENYFGKQEEKHDP